MGLTQQLHQRPIIDRNDKASTSTFRNALIVEILQSHPAHQVLHLHSLQSNCFVAFISYSFAMCLLFKHFKHLFGFFMLNLWTDPDLAFWRHRFIFTLPLSERQTLLYQFNFYLYYLSGISNDESNAYSDSFHNTSWSLMRRHDASLWSTSWIGISYCVILLH